MASVLRSCTQSFLKLSNSMIGLGMILYGLWLIRAWTIHFDNSPFDFPDSLAPWFIYAFLATGVIFCVVTCSGHVAAATANGCCLYLYMFFIFLLFLMEAAVTFDVFVNHNSEEGVCMLLALILKAQGPHQYYDSDDDVDTARLPLLHNNAYRPAYDVGDTVYGTPNNKAWKSQRQENLMELQHFTNYIKSVAWSTETGVN